LLKSDGKLFGWHFRYKQELLECLKLWHKPVFCPVFHPPALEYKKVLVLLLLLLLLVVVVVVVVVVAVEGVVVVVDYVFPLTKQVSIAVTWQDHIRDIQFDNFFCRKILLLLLLLLLLFCFIQFRQEHRARKYYSRFPPIL
jgi:type III secretory pathway component EscU